MLVPAITLTLLAGCANRTSNTDSNTDAEQMAEPDSADTAVAVDWYEAADHQPSRLVSSYRHVIGPAEEHGGLSIASASKRTGISPRASARSASATAPGSGSTRSSEGADEAVRESTSSDSTDQEQKIAQSGEASSATGSDEGSSSGDNVSDLPWAHYCAADSRKRASLTDEEFHKIREWQNRTGEVAPQRHQPCTGLK
jgi:hypothetical protein